MQSKKSHRYAWYLFVLQCLFVGTAFSEDRDIRKIPVTIPIGGFELSPVFEVGETFSDNIFRNNFFKRSSFVTQINAGGKLSLKRKFNNYGLTYAFQSSQYHSSPQDDYVDNFVGINTHTEFTSRNRLDLDVGYFNSHYMRGNFLDLNIANPNPVLATSGPNQYQLYDANIRYVYGEKTARGNLELTSSLENYTFDNNQEITASYDRTSIEVAPGFYFRAFPNTTLLAQIENSWIIHKDARATEFDNNKQRFMLGGNWLHSKQFQTEAKIGYLQLAIDNPTPNLNRYHDATWNLDVIWSPLPYSKLSFNASRDAVVSISSNNIRTSDRYSTKWSHEWSDRISTQVSTSYESADNIGVNRRDDFVSFGLDLNYGVKRWLGVGVNYSYRTLQSDNQSINFDQNTILFFVTANPRLSDDIKTPWTTWY